MLAFRPGIGDDVELKTPLDDWTEGRVVALDEADPSRVRVRYHGMNAEWDTWHSLDSDSVRWDDPPAPSVPAEEESRRRPFAFHCAYNGVDVTEGAMIDALCARGLRRSLSRDKACIFQWVPYSRILWSRVLAGSMIGSGHYVHSDVGHKVRLFSALRAVARREAPLNPASPLGQCAASLVPIHTFDIEADPGALTRRLPALVSGGAAWVLKADSANNATAVHFVNERTLPDLLPLLRDAERGIVGGGGFVTGASHHARWLLQKHISKPLLVAGRKFHLRVNVLAHGSLALYVHRECVAHVCVERYDPRDLANEFSNVTNNAVQRHHAGFDAARNTLGMAELECALAAERGEEEARHLVAALWSRIKSVVVGVFEGLSTTNSLSTTVFQQKSLLLASRSESSSVEPALEEEEGAAKRKKARKIPFFPNCFEVYGFDFLPGDDGELYLLEVNVGPALEGHCKPAICKRVIDDVVRIVLDPLLAAAATAAAAAAALPPALPALLDPNANGRAEAYERALARAAESSEEETRFERVYFGRYDSMHRRAAAGGEGEGEGEGKGEGEGAPPPMLWSPALRTRAVEWLNR